MTLVLMSFKFKLADYLLRRYCIHVLRAVLTIGLGGAWPEQVGGP